MSDSESNSFRSPAAAPAGNQQPAAFTLSWMFIFAVVLMGGLLLAMALTRGKFAEVFAEFDATLPMVTEFALSGTALAIVALMFVVTIAKEFAGKNRLTRVWNVVACLFTLFAITFYVLAVFMPYMNLMTKLSSSGA